MAWCLTSSSVDVDFDCTFKENPNIREKIKISENIISALKASGCKLSLLPPQIQGLNYERLLPVIKWLVSRSLEYRSTFERQYRREAESQYSKYICTPSDKEGAERKTGQLKYIEDLDNSLGLPERKFRQKKRNASMEEELRVQRILLEYGRTGIAVTAQKKKKSGEEEEDEEAERIRQLMKGMDSQDDDQGGHVVPTSIVGNLMTLGRNEIIKASDLYNEEKKETEKGQKQQDKRAQKQQIEALQKQIAALRNRLENAQNSLNTLTNKNKQMEDVVGDQQKELAEIKEQLEDLRRAEEEHDPAVVEQLRQMVALNESLKRQEKQFKESCKAQLEYWEAKLTEAQRTVDPNTDEHTVRLSAALEEENEKMNKMRVVLAQKNRSIAALQRQLDEVPSRPELLQYQTRFIELFQLIGQMFSETRKYYTTFNGLLSKKESIEKETNTIRSIIEAFPISMKNKQAQQKLVESIETIVEQTGRLLKVQTDRLDQERSKYQTLTRKYNELVEDRKRYLAITKKLQEEMEKNVLLHQKLEEKEADEEEEEEDENE
ncbi:putative Coiled-coil domain-containing protein (DUF2037) [Blattamonas nauphoetae]|uniref:Coiled-coil domain-containing protein (DUF2037) n=1 Tax=Blattamonas nauphoetae TaxID=2049346 RepID=A0ABQ9YFB1_9EUKA|nr:putative Coiled-coil domain-containing protein (DUF2037) [Blattamonas nauphoetae]